MAVRLLDAEPYRTFQIGYVIMKYGLRPCWRSVHGGKWKVAPITVDYEGQIEDSAKVCIDQQYKIEAEECMLGRKLTWEELKTVVEQP